MFTFILQGVPKVTVQRIGLIARPVIIRSAKFLQECSWRVAHSRNTVTPSVSLIKLGFILKKNSTLVWKGISLTLDHSVKDDLLPIEEIYRQAPTEIVNPTRITGNAALCLIFVLHTTNHFV